DKNNEKCEMETKQTIENYIKLKRKSASTKLEKMLEAIFIRKGISADSLDIMNTCLEKILKNLQDKFSEEQRKQKVNEIWNKLRNNLLSKNQDKPVEIQIDEEVDDEYSKILRADLYNKYKNGIKPDLSQCKAYNKIEIMRFSSNLERRDIDLLYNKINNLINFILTEKEHFYNGIVRELKGKLDKMLNDYSANLNIKFLFEFKWNVHVYTLLTFKSKMISFQANWDKEHTPLGMLDQKKDEYLNVINNRLRYSHECLSEGHTNGVLRNAWISNAETIRLRYFNKLAEQVHEGYKQEAIRYFINPQRSIEEWFKDSVNKDSSGNPEQKYNDTFNAEFGRVHQEIRNCQSFEEIKVFVNDYMTQVDKIDYKLDLKDSSSADFNIFRNAIEEEFETKGNGRYPKQESFQKPSDDESVMEKLGCTEPCLCGVNYLSTRELVVESCHATLDDCNVRYNSILKKWGEIKSKDFPNWKFEPHYNTIFNDLMSWFFKELHEDLAKYHDLVPARQKEMEKSGCLNLNYVDIASVLREK
ncbi:14434_t:CDS:2, partial [Racocetra fulgida]